MSKEDFKSYGDSSTFNRLVIFTAESLDYALDAYHSSDILYDLLAEGDRDLAVFVRDIDVVHIIRNAHYQMNGGYISPLRGKAVFQRTSCASGGGIGGYSISPDNLMSLGDIMPGHGDHTGLPTGPDMEH